MNDTVPWQKQDKGMVHSNVISYVQSVEQEQFDTYERFCKLEYLYDHTMRNPDMGSRNREDAQVITNVIASNVDTVASAISATEVRCRFMTDDADYSVQRQAKHLEWYSDGLTKKFKIHMEARRAFKDSALLGTGLVKVFANQHNQMRVERVAVADIIVDCAEERGTKPQQLHHRAFISKSDLRSQFPQHVKAIDAADVSDEGIGRRWAGYRHIDNECVVIIESWYLPRGIEGKDGYEPGRHTICVSGADLLDEKWHKERFPFAVMRWSERTRGFYGIGGAERIAGHQRAVNRLNWQIDAQINQHAFPTTYVQQMDTKLAITTLNRCGSFIPVKGEYPKTVIPQSVAPEQFARLERIESSAFEEFGVSRMAATSAKPSGLDSGVALREYRDQTTQRFALQEKDFESLVLDIVWLMLDVCKDLGDDAPEVQRKTRYGKNKFKWSDVDLSEVELQLEAASNISKTPAGRTQLVMEYAQAGIITTDEARSLMGHPDMESAMSYYTASRESITRKIEAVLDSETGLTPGPFDDLKMGTWMFNQAYLKAENDNAPEEVLESLRAWSTMSAFMLSEQERKQQEQMAMMQAQTQMQAQLPAPEPAQLPEGPAMVPPGPMAV